MPNILQNIISRLHGKGALPLPTAGGYTGIAYSGGQFSFTDYLTVGGRPLPINPQDAGDPLLNPIVTICLGWIGTSWPLAVPVVGRMQGADFTPDPREHPLVGLLRQPNPTYSGKWLMWALNCDYWTRGNAYAQIVPGVRGVQELNYLPADLVTPIPGADGYLTRYDYSAGGKVYPVAPEEMLHIRYGINPANVLLGISPLRAAFRELVTDNGSSDYSAGLFRNGGIPPAILTPDSSKDDMGSAPITEEEATRLTEKLNFKMSREPGRIRLLTRMFRLLQLSFKPAEMGLNQVREMPETRIPALFQIPPVVLGLRAGLQQSTYNNVREAKAAAWTGCLVPTQDYFAEEISNKVLRYYPDGKGKVLRYDRGNVGELQDDENAKREQARADYQAGLLTLEEARAEGGRQTDASTRSQIVAERPQPVQIGGAAGAKSLRPFLSVKADDDTPDLYAAVERFRSALRALEDDAVEEMGAAYETAAKRLQERLDALQASIEEMRADGQEIPETVIRQEQRYIELSAQIDQELDALGVRGVEITEGLQRDGGTAVMEHAETLTRAALGPGPVGASIEWNRLPKEALTQFVGFASDGSPLKDLFDGIKRGQELKDSIVDAIASGINPREVAKQFQDGLDMTQWQALRIARTEMNRAHREASLQSYAANQDVVTAWVWSAACDRRTCAGCWVMQGSEHPLSERLDDHPNGRCVAIPKTKSWGELLGDDTIPDTRPKVSEGSELWAETPEDLQKEILGDSLYEAWRGGKVFWEDLVSQDSDPRWGTTRRAATLAEALERAEARRNAEALVNAGE